MASISFPVAGVAAAGGLGPINNAESLVSGFGATGALGFYGSRALRSPAAAGYVRNATTTLIEIDRPVDLRDCVCEPHRLTIVMADGSLESRYLLANCGETTANTGTQPGPQFLESDDYPNTGPQPDSFTVSVDSGPAVPVGTTSNTDGSVYLHYDLTTLGLGTGTHSVTVVAVSALWGNSAPVTSALIVPAAIATTLEVEVAFGTTPPIGARWILTDGYEVGAGHVVSGTVNHITLDNAVELDICEDYTFTTFAPDGTQVEAQDTLTDCDDDALVLDLDANLAVAPDPGWIWVLRSADVGWEDATAIPLGVAAVGLVQAPTATTVPGEAPVFGFTVFGQLGTVVAAVSKSVDVTGIAATGSVGAIDYRQDQLLTAAGVAATGQLGTVTAEQGADTAPAGVSATLTLGTVAVNVHIDVAVTGLQASVLAGAVVVENDGEFPVFGDDAVGSVGSVSIVLSTSAAVTGVSATCALGSVSVIATGDDQIAVTGVENVGAVGDLSTTHDQDVDLLGASSDASVGSLLATGQGNIAEPLGVQTLCLLGVAVARGSSERHRVLHVARTRPRRVLRVSISSDGLPFTRT